MESPQCSIEMFFYTTVEKSEQYYDFYQCAHCGKPTHTVRYKYTPDTCPLRNGQKHQYEGMGQIFHERSHAHEIFQADRCDLCGDVRLTPRHTAAAGISGRLDLEDPRVQLLWNTSAMKRLLSKEIMNEFGSRLPLIGAELPAESEV